MYANLALLYLLCSWAHASLVSQEATQAVESVARRFGTHLAPESAEKISVLAAKCGAKDTIECFKKLGPDFIRLVESSGNEAPRAVNLLNRYGQRAVPIVSDARRLRLAACGEDAVN